LKPIDEIEKWVAAICEASINPLANFESEHDLLKEPVCHLR
jgi:hypothetical protein